MQEIWLFGYFTIEYDNNAFWNSEHDRLDLSASINGNH